MDYSHIEQRAKQEIDFISNEYEYQLNLKDKKIEELEEKIKELNSINKIFNSVIERNSENL